MKVVAKSVAAVALLALVAAPAARAAEATVGVDVSSAYVFRGVTLNDGAVAQPYLEVSGLPVDLGVWGNFDIDDYDGKLEDGEFSEIDIYGSYAIPVEGVDASVGYTEYAYGRASDREVSLSVGLDLPLAPAVGLYYGLDGAIEEQFYADLSVGHDLELAEGVGLSLGGLISYIVQGDNATADDGLNQYEVSASLSYEFVSLGVKYIGQLDDDVLVDVEEGGGYDVEVVGTLGLSHSF